MAGYLLFLFWQIFDIFGIVQSGIGQLETAYKKIPFKLSLTHYSDVYLAIHIPRNQNAGSDEAIIWISYGKDGCGYPYILWLLYSGNFTQQNKTKGRSVNDSKDLCIYVVDCNQVDRFIFYRNLPDFLVKKTLHKQLTFDKKYVCFKITNSARYEWGSRYGKRKERETDT